MSENTTLPQRSSGLASFGVVNWNICGLIVVEVIRFTQRSAFVLSTDFAVARALWTVTWPRTVEPATPGSIIQSANATPFGLCTSSIVSVVGSSGSGAMSLGCTNFAIGAVASAHT